MVGAIISEQMIEELEKKYITFNDLAKILNISPSYLHRIKNLNELKYTSVFNLYVVPVEEANRLIAAKKESEEKIKAAKQSKQERQAKLKDKVNIHELKAEARALALRIYGSKSELKARIKAAKQAQKTNPAIGHPPSYLITHAYLYSTSELTMALKQFTKNEINHALDDSGFELISLKNPKQKFIQLVINQIGVGFE